MYTQEIYFCCSNSLSINYWLDGSTRNKCKKFAISGSFNTNMPVFDIIWPTKGPTNEIDRVVEPKNASLIFNIVFTKKMENLFSFLIVFQIKDNPFKPLW